MITFAVILLLCLELCVSYPREYGNGNPLATANFDSSASVGGYGYTRPGEVFPKFDVEDRRLFGSGTSLSPAASSISAILESDMCNYPSHKFLCRDIGKKVHQGRLSGAAQTLDLQKVAPPNFHTVYPTQGLSSKDTPLVPQAAQDSPVRSSEQERYQGVDKCKHAFHSFLCGKPAGSKPASSLRGDSSFVRESSLLLPVFQTTSQPQRPSAATVTPPRSLPPVRYSPPERTHGGSSVIPQREEQPQAAQQPEVFVQTTEHYQGADKCKHAFHSFLCNPPRPSSMKQPVSPALKGDSSFVRESSLLLPAYQTTLKPKVPVTQPPTARTRPPTPPPRPSSTNTVPRLSLPSAQAAQQIPLVARENEHYKGVDKCKHAFHSFLCNPGKGRRVPTKTVSPTAQSSFIRESSLLLPQYQVPVSPQPSPTTRPPTTTPKQTTEPNIIPQAAQQQFSVFQRAQTTTEGADKCTHSFHSFLCNPSKAKPTTRPPATILRGDSSFIRESGLLLPTFQESTSKPTVSTKIPRPTVIRTNLPATQAPFSVRTNPPTTRRPTQAPTRRPELVPQAAQQPQTVVQRTEHYKGVDKCKHAFHSFLCNPPPRRAQASRNFPSRAPPSISRGDHEVRQSSLLLPAYQESPAESRQKPDVLVPTIAPTRPPLQRVSPVSSTTIQQVLLPQAAQVSPQRTLNTGADKCKHAFHSFLCNPSSKSSLAPQPRQSATSPVAPPGPPVAESSKIRESSLLLPAYQQPNTRKQPADIPRTTTRAPPPRQGSAATLNTARQLPDNCNHPFHGFLCNGSRRRFRTRRRVRNS